MFPSLPIPRKCNFPLHIFFSISPFRYLCPTILLPPTPSPCYFFVFCGYSTLISVVTPRCFLWLLYIVFCGYSTWFLWLLHVIFPHLEFWKKDWQIQRTYSDCLSELESTDSGSYLPVPPFTWNVTIPFFFTAIQNSIVARFSLSIHQLKDISFPPIGWQWKWHGKYLWSRWPLYGHISVSGYSFVICRVSFSFLKVLHIDL